MTKSKRIPNNDIDRVGQDKQLATLNTSRDRIWQKPPSNFMQHLNIWVTLLLTATATLIAITSFFQTQQIQGMQEMLSTFNAKVKYTPEEIIINKDSISLNGRVKNYGTRNAKDITTRIWMLSDSVCWLQKSDILLDLASNDVMSIKLATMLRTYLKNDGVNEHYIEDFELQNLSFVFKINFTDELTNKQDSTITYGVNIARANSPIKLRSAYQGDKDSLDLLCALVEFLAPPEKVVNAKSAQIEMKKRNWRLEDFKKHVVFHN